MGTSSGTSLRKPFVFRPGEARALFYLLCGAYQTRQFTFRQFNDALNALRFYDGGGTVWTIGAGSGRWYFLDGREWVIGQPKGRLVIIVEQAWYDYLRRIDHSGTCHKCGAAFSPSSRFCLSCGAPVAAVSTSPAGGPKAAYCRQCGQPVAAGARFCKTCGARRQQGA